MTCDEAHNLMNARLDGEITAADDAALQSHLTDCPCCRATQAELTAQHDRLREAFADHHAAARRVADRVLASRPPLRRQRSILPWLSTILSAAAGFALAWAIFRVPTRPHSTQSLATQPTTRPAAVAHLTLATGEVQSCATGTSDWSALPTGGAVAAGTRLRTGPAVRCEFRLNDGSELRLDENTELTLASPRRFDLSTGQA
jgi:anti-sigma factor RsiW